MVLLIDEVHNTIAGEEPGGGRRGWPDGNGSEAHQNSRTPSGQRLDYDGKSFPARTRLWNVGGAA